MQAWERTRYTRLGVRLILAVTSAIILYLPILLRRKGWLLTGIEAYYHLKQGALSFLLGLIPADSILAAKMLPLIFGIAAVLLFYTILLNLGIGFKVAFGSSVLLLMTPGYIYLFSTLNGYFIPVTIALLMFYLLLRRKDVFLVPFLFVMPFFGYLHSLAASLLLLAFCLERKVTKLFLLSLIPLMISLFAGASMMPSHGSFISDFGGKFGIGLFILLLSFFGFGSLWKKKYRYTSVYLALISLVALAMLDMRMLGYLNMILVVLALLGFMRIAGFGWESAIIKWSTVGVLTFSIVFSGLFYMAMLANDLPNREIVAALESLKAMSKESDIVLAHNTREYWIGYAGRKSISVPGIYSSRYHEEALQLLAKNNIRYVWVDEGMKDILWQEGRQDILFLLEYSNLFKKVYINDYVTIWEVIR